MYCQSQFMQKNQKSSYNCTLKDVDSGTFSVGWMTICAIGAFPTKYVLERSPMTDSNADSAHCKVLTIIGGKKQQK